MWKKDRKYNGKRKKDKIKTMVATTLSTKNTTINREENKNNGGHYIEYQQHHYKS